MDYIGATPQANPLLGLLAERLKQAQQFAAKPFGYSNPPAEMLMNLLGVPAVQQTAERLAYGEPLTTGRGMTTQIRPEAVEAALTVAPVAGLLGKGAETAAMAAGRAGERYAEKVVPQIMERGGMPAQLLGDLAQGSRRQIFVPASQEEAFQASKLLKRKTPEEVWQETGVGKYGGEYVKEISDDLAKIKEERLPEQYITDIGYVPSWKLGNVLEHPELMKAYPDLAGIESSFRGGAGAQSAKASYNPAMDWISYNKEMYQKGYITKAQQEQLLNAKEKYDNFLETKEYKDYDKLLNDKLDQTGDFASLDPLINKELENKKEKLWNEYYGNLQKIQKEGDQGYTLGSGQSARSTTMHEVQHAIQQRAGWQGGGNAEDIAKGLFFERDNIHKKIGDLNQQMREAVGTPKYDDLMEQRMSLVNELQSKGLDDPMKILQKAHDQYEALGGEAQARLTQTRLNLTPEQRRQYFPFAYGKENYGLDVKPENIIFRSLLD